MKQVLRDSIIVALSCAAVILLHGVVLGQSCQDNIIQNWSFIDSSNSGPMPSPGESAHWERVVGWNGTETPDVQTTVGCGDSTYIGMWGNRVVGEAINQTGVNILAGHLYELSLCVFWDSVPNRPYPPRVRVQASNTVVTSITDGVTIGLTEEISVGRVWMTTEPIRWVAPDDYSIITVNVENRSSFDAGDSTTYAGVDRICLSDLGPCELSIDTVQSMSLAFCDTSSCPALDPDGTVSPPATEAKQGIFRIDVCSSADLILNFALPAQLSGGSNLPVRFLSGSAAWSTTNPPLPGDWHQFDPKSSVIIPADAVDPGREIYVFLGIDFGPECSFTPGTYTGILLADVQYGGGPYTTKSVEVAKVTSQAVLPISVSISGCPSWCPDNIIQNGSFDENATSGEMPSPGQTANWATVTGWPGTTRTPDVRTTVGCGDSAYVGMWGSQAYGEAIQQTGLNIIKDHLYELSLCVSWDSIPNRPLPPRVRVQASNAPLTSTTGGTVIAVTPDNTIVPEQWTTFTSMQWIAPANFSMITVSVENRSAGEVGDSTTYAGVDRICLRDLGACTTSVAVIQPLSFTVCDTVQNVILSPDGSVMPPLESPGWAEEGVFRVLTGDRTSVDLAFTLPTSLTCGISVSYTSVSAAWSSTYPPSDWNTFSPMSQYSIPVNRCDTIYVYLGASLTVPPSAVPGTCTGAGVLDASGIQAEFQFIGNLVDCDPLCAEVDSLIINTGWNQYEGDTLKIDSLDNEWYVVSDPDDNTDEPRYAVVIPTYYPDDAWAWPQSGSQWISSYNTAENERNGSYKFEYYFCLADSESAYLFMKIRADDSAAVYLNGHPIGSTGGWSFKPYNQPVIIFTDNPPFFRHGQNTITVDVHNTSAVAMGLNITGSVHGLLPQYSYCCTDRGGLTGVKWNDIDGDCNKDEGEPAMSGWTVTLYSQNTGTVTAITDKWGNYCFTSLPEGEYMITEDIQDGWMQTCPPAGSHTVYIGKGEVIGNLNFGNRVDPLSRGTYFNKDFKNTTGDTVNNIEIVLEGEQEIIWHYDNQLGGDSTYVDGMFHFSSSVETGGGGTTTVLKWDALDVPPGGVVHVGFQTETDSVVVKKMYWTKDSVCVGEITQVNICTSDDDTTGVIISNNLLDCDEQPRGTTIWQSCVKIEFYRDILPLEKMNRFALRYPIYEESFSPSPSELAPGGSDTVVFADPPPEANYMVWIFDLDTDPGMSSPAAVRDYVQFPIRRVANVDVNGGWNMISVPVITQDNSVNNLFPGAISAGFAYQGGYQILDTLLPGKGIWIKFGSPRQISMAGYNVNSVSVSVDEGWNMMGTLSDTILPSSIISSPPGIITSQCFGYDGGGYHDPGLLLPNKGFWIKVGMPGTLTLSANLSEEIFAKNGIKIVPTSELPPPPPDDIQDAPAAAPEEYALGEAYPNPFNPSASIEYRLPFESRVTLKIYDLLGQVVAVLKDAVEEPGIKYVVWDARNAASGVYFYRLDASSLEDPGRSFSNLKKMVLMR